MPMTSLTSKIFCLSGVQYCIAVAVLCCLFGCSPSEKQKTPDTRNGGSGLHQTESLPRVLLVNSYHFAFPWTRDITTSVASVFKVALDDQGQVAGGTNSLVELAILYLDTKRNTDADFARMAAEQAKEFIEKWQPQVLIISDDNAAKYLVAPYYNSGRPPVVFCGINWSADEYGFAPEHVTGMLEVQLIDQLILQMRKYARGGRIAYLKGDDSSARKESHFFEQLFGLALDKRFVTTFAQWQQEYLQLQQEADMLLLGNVAALADWDEIKAKQLIAEHTVIPTGNWDKWMAPFALITLATRPSEHGEWAARQALNIINGVSPEDIPVAQNKKSGMYLNMTIARKLGITFPMELVNQAELVH